MGAKKAQTEGLRLEIHKKGLHPGRIQRSRASDMGTVLTVIKNGIQHEAQLLSF